MTPFDAMQRAVDIVNNSPHATNKIAAALFTPGFCHAAFNHWPAEIAAAFPTHAQIGNSSGTVHAETVCLLNTPVTHGAHICITDPFCPNCAKNMVEAGIKHIYIDHKGFAKDFAERRGDDFETLSLRIVARAGIPVSIVNRKEQTISTLAPPESDPVMNPEHHIHLIPARAGDRQALQNAVQTFTPPTPTTPFAGAGVTDTDGDSFILITPAHLTLGYHPNLPHDRAELAHLTAGTKYTPLMEPVNRLMFHARRLGLVIDPGLIVCSRIPHAREQVNMVAAGLTRLQILDMTGPQAPGAQEALDQLTTAGILHLV